MLSTVIGVGLTLVLGVAGILITYKTVRRTSVSYLQVSLIALFRAIVKDIASIRILYKDAPVDPGLFLLRAAVFNTGSNDVDKSRVYDKLNLQFPKQYKLVECNVEESSTRATIAQVGNGIEFSWDLLKREEFIAFKALLKLDPEHYSEGSLTGKAGQSLFDHLFQNIRLSHRILDLDKVKKKKASEFDLAFTRFHRFQRILLAASAALLLLSMGLFAFANQNTKIGYRYRTNDGQTIIADFTVDRNNVITVSQTNGQLREKHSFSTFDVSSIQGVEPLTNWDSIVAGITMVSLVLGFAVFLGIREIMSYRLRRKYGKLLQALK